MAADDKEIEEDASFWMSALSTLISAQGSSFAMRAKRR
jgi:hypothetical protein